eukprot:evm.model.NODE_13524_length_29135_cov_30.666414.1
MASLEAMMPNQAKQPTPGDKEKMVKYRASQAANASGIASTLKDIQGRRTGLVINDRVSKDSEGFEDIDAFWELASTGADELSQRGSSAGGRAARRAAAGVGSGGGNSVGRYSPTRTTKMNGTTTPLPASKLELPVPLQQLLLSLVVG